MGLEIKQNKEGLFKILNHSVSPTASCHEGKEWITAEEAKLVMINRAMWEFFQKIAEIDMDFPAGYRVNDKYDQKERKYFDWIFKKSKAGTLDDELCEKFVVIMNKLGWKIEYDPALDQSIPIIHEQK